MQLGLFAHRHKQRDRDMLEVKDALVQAAGKIEESGNGSGVVDGARRLLHRVLV